MNIIKATAQFFSLNKYLRKSSKEPVGYFSWLHVTMTHHNQERIMKLLKEIKEYFIYLRFCKVIGIKPSGFFARAKINADKLKAAKNRWVTTTNEQ